MNEEIAAYIAAQTGHVSVSDWLTVDQSMISQFAHCTMDHYFIHTDPQAAAATEFGGTIAHGFLVLSLLAPLRAMAPMRQPFPHMRMGVNYGIESLRWVQPVRSGSRIRGQFTTAEITETHPGRYREDCDVSVEVEGNERPALVARWLTLYLT